MQGDHNFLARRFQNINASATTQMTQLARDLRAQGADIISLSMGEPNFDTPAHIRAAAQQAMSDGKTRYTAVDGITELKAAIAAKFKRDNDLEYDLEQINVSPGGKAVLFNALAVTLSQGDDVIIPVPCWVSYPEMVRLCGGRPVLVPCGADQGFKITAQQLEAAITPQTKWLMLNSPSNPTGAVYSAQELQSLAQILRNNPHVLVLCDDIYEYILYTDQPFATLAQIAPDLKPRILTMNGVSKGYAMTGWRIGYAGGPDWLIKAMAKYMGQTTSNPCSLSQWAALAALTGPQDFLQDWRADYQLRRDYVMTQLGQIKGVDCGLPSGAFYIFIDVRAVLKSHKHLRHDQDLALDILQKTGVALIAGSAFHMDGHLRLSYSMAMDKLDIACARLKDYFQSL